MNHDSVLKELWYKASCLYILCGFLPVASGLTYFHGWLPSYYIYNDPVSPEHNNALKHNANGYAQVFPFLLLSTLMRKGSSLWIKGQHILLELLFHLNSELKYHIAVQE